MNFEKLRQVVAPPRDFNLTYWHSADFLTACTTRSPALNPAEGQLGGQVPREIEESGLNTMPLKLDS